MDKKNREYVSPEMDVILLERGDDVCTASGSGWCVIKPDGTNMGDFPIIECSSDEGCTPIDDNF